MKFWNWVVDHKASIARNVLWIMVLVIPTISLGFCVKSGPGWSVQATFPGRISDSSSSIVPVFINDYDDRDSLDDGKLSLYAGWGNTADDAATTIADDDGVLLSTAQSNKTGYANLALPTRPEIVEKLPAKTVEKDQNDQMWLAIVVERGWSKRVQFQSYSSDSSPRAIVTLDRPLYQPGQRVHARVLLLDRDSGAPISTSGSWILKNSDNQTLAKRVVDVSEFGIASAKFSLSRHLKPGPYRVEFYAPNVTVSNTITVKPYRLPRFKVSVDGPAKPVTRGETLTFTVKANYTYGTPLEDADIRFNTTVAGIPQTELTGKTNKLGLATFEVRVPADAANGTVVSTNAKVTLKTGRAEVGYGSAVVAGRTLSVEIFPVGSYLFSQGLATKGFVYVSDQRGSGVKDAQVILTMGEEGQEQEVRTSTDEYGIAYFEWRPGPKHESHYIVVDVKAGLDAVKLQLSPPVGTDDLKLKQSVFVPGDSVEVSTSDNQVVLLARDGVILDSAISTGGIATLKVEKTARGLATVSRFQNGNIVDSKPIWVQSGANDTVEIVPGSAEYRPGTQAEVLLKVPESEEKTIFGLIGVDEALYALAERSDAPFTAQALGVPEEANSVLTMLMLSDPPSVLWGARFMNGLRHIGTNHGLNLYSNDISTAVKLRSLYWVTMLWLTFLCGFVAFFSWRAGRLSWQAVSADAFSWRRLFSLFGISLLAGVIGFFFALADGEFLAGGLAVWVGVVLTWLVATAVLDDENQLGGWLVSLALLLLTFVLLGVWIDEVARFDSRSTDEILAIVAIAIPAGVLLIQAIVWCFILLRDGRRKPAYGLISIAGALLLGIAGGSMSMLGTSVEYKMEAPAMMQESRNVQFARDDVEPSSVAPEAKESESGKKNAPGNQPEPATGPRVRSWFPETMVFLPEIVGEGSEAVAKFEVPDSITTWRLNAYAHSVGGAFAAGQKGMTVIQPLFIELDVPSTLIQGDEIEVAATVVNSSANPVSGTLDISGDGSLSISVKGNLNLDANQRETVFARVKASAIGEGKIVAKFIDSNGNPDLQDAVTRPIDVRADGRSGYYSQSTFVKNEWNPAPTFRAPPITGSTSSYLRLFPNVAAFALDGLESMLRQPDGCFEQTSSANYPNVLVLLALKTSKPEKYRGGAKALEAAKERAHEYVELGYQRMLTFRNYDGGFGYYPGRASDLMLTAYGIVQLLEMQKVIEIDNDVIVSAIDYLTSNQQSDGSWSTYAGRIGGGRSGGKDFGHGRATAFLFLALSSSDNARWKGPKESASNYLAKLIAERDLAVDVLAVAANGFALNGEKERAREALSKVVASIQRRGELAFVKNKHPIWFGMRGDSADLQVTAQAAYAMVKADLFIEHAAPMVNYLAQRRSSWGGWGSTQATVWSLRTLTALQDDVAETTDVTVEQTGQTRLSTANDKPTVTLDLASPLYTNYDLPNADPVTVRATKIMNFGAQLVTRYAVSWNAPPASEEFRVVSKATASLTFGVKTENVVTIATGPTAWSNVIVELPIGPGGFVETELLEQWQSAGRVAAFEQHLNFIRLYIDDVHSNSELAFAYAWTPLIRGTYRLPPVKVYPFYNPELITESRSQKVTVR